MTIPPCNTLIVSCRIEHVYPDVLEEVPFHIFGTIRPKVAVITTPNGEFNVLFNLKPFQYRHYDHKFEWTRSEFEDWCNHICVRFPDYCVQFHGIGQPPEGSEKLGCVSQMGLFIRKDFLESLEHTEVDDAVTEESQEEVVVDCEEYKLIHSVRYPFFYDTRNRDQKILDECKYQVQRLQGMGDDFFNDETNRFEIPILRIADCCWQVSEDLVEIHLIVEKNFETEGNFVILPPYEESDHEDDYYSDENQTPASEGDLEQTLEDFNVPAIGEN